MLAWWRTALATIGFSAALLQFADSRSSDWMAYIGFLIGISFFLIGALRYRMMKKRICQTRIDQPDPDCPT